jgi:predicted MFS family arabinose efflux permease
MGRLATAFMLGYFITSPIFGYLGDRLSRKKLMAIGVIGWSLGTCLSGVAQVYSFMVFCRIMVGLGEASFGAIGPAVISDAYSSKRRNKAINFFYLAIPIGAALGFALGGIIAASLGWRAAFFITGLPGFVLAILLLLMKEPERGQSEEVMKEVKKVTVSQIMSLFKNREYMLACLGYIFYTFAMGAFSYWGPSFLSRVHHMKIQDASLFLGPTLVVGGIIGTLIGGHFSDKWRKKSASGYAKLLAISVLIAVPFSFVSFLTTDKLTSMVTIVITMIFLFQSTGPINTVIVESVPPNMRASAMAICIFLIHAFGDLWSPELVGRVSDSQISYKEESFDKDKTACGIGLNSNAKVQHNSKNLILNSKGLLSFPIPGNSNKFNLNYKIIHDGSSSIISHKLSTKVDSIKLTWVEMNFVSSLADTTLSKGIYLKVFDYRKISNRITKGNIYLRKDEVVIYSKDTSWIGNESIINLKMNKDGHFIIDVNGRKRVFKSRLPSSFYDESQPYFDHAISFNSDIPRSKCTIDEISFNYTSNLRMGMLILPGAFILAAVFWILLIREQNRKGAMGLLKGK